MPAALAEGAEPFAASNGVEGVLVLHGFTGSPRSVRPLAEALANEGFTVEAPLLPGHGTEPADLVACGFSDWCAAAEHSYAALAAHTDRTVVVGHSMGGTLACHLAETHRDIAGLVLINPLVEPPADSFIGLLDASLAAGVTELPSIGADVKRGPVDTGGYATTPIAPMISLFAGVAEVAARLGDIVCPVLLLSSRTDHVVPPSSGDLVESAVAGPVERVFLENSYHVATLDNDAPELEERTVAFARKVLAG